MSQKIQNHMNLLDTVIDNTDPSYINVSQIGKDRPHKSKTSNASAVQPEVKIRRLERVGTACCDYIAKEQDELSLKHGSVVEILREECGETGWILAKVDNKKGMVPKNYVVLVGSQPNVIASKDIQRTTELLGAGGFADVFLGYYKNEKVALKVSRTNSHRDRETLTREALILSRMAHKNIVGFYGLSLNPLFIVLELCEGQTLFALGRKMCSSDVMTVIYWAKQVGEAIQHLHSREDPLVYADLKAENVLIKEIPCLCGLEDDSWKTMTNYDKNGHCRKCNGLCIKLLTLKLADFNVSRTLSVKRDSCAGSILWMPPEVIQDRNFSKSSDVWSFGMFLWEIFSRKVPFKNCELHVIISAIVYKEETLPLPNGLPAELRIIFEECWRKRPEERPAIPKILDYLELAEQKVDNFYKWVLPEENMDNAKSDSGIITVLEDISKDSREGKSVTIPLYEAVMFMERLGVDQKLGGMIKRLGLSFYPPTPAKRLKKPKLDKQSIGAPCDFRHNVSARLRSASPPLGDRSGSHEKLLVIRYLEDEENTAKRPHYRSHDSLIDQGKDDNSAIYSTLPRNFKQKCQCQKKCNESKKCKLRHDYLVLAPCMGSCRHAIITTSNDHKLSSNPQNNRAIITTTSTNDFKKQNNEQLESFGERALSRANAIRPKINNLQQNNHNESSSCSSSLDEFVVVGESGDLHNSREQPKQMNLPDLFNRRVSPPQLQSPSTPNTSRASTQEFERTKERRRRKTSNDQMPNSVFYIDPLEEESTQDVEDADPINDTNRRRSGRFGLFVKIFGTSPRQSTSADDVGDVVVETARCYHPNHEDGYHLCPLRPSAVLLPEISLSRSPELKKSSFIIQPNCRGEQKGYRKRMDNPEMQRQRQRTESTTSTLPKRMAKSPTDLHGTRLSMNTVIEMQHHDGSTAGECNLKSKLWNQPNGRSYTDLHSSISPRQEYGALLSPTNVDNFHQRSRSSESSISQQRTTTASELIQRLLQPVPANGLILNPSYIPMRENQKNPPLPSKKGAVPVPLPRTKLPSKNVDCEDLPWPTSIAPILNKAELAASNNNKPIQRPNSLGLQLAPPTLSHIINSSSPLTTPTTSNSVFTNSSNSFGAPKINHCDSGIDPEVGTEGENSPHLREKMPVEHSTVFPSTPNSSPRTQIQKGPISLRSRIPSGIPQLPTTPPPPPPLPPKKITDRPRVPPIPKNMRKTNHRF